MEVLNVKAKSQANNKQVVTTKKQNENQQRILKIYEFCHKIQ